MRVLALSTVTGNNGKQTPLDSTKLMSLKRMIQQILPAVPPGEFEDVWKSGCEAICDQCKRYQSQLRQHNLLEIAANNEGRDAYRNFFRVGNIDSLLKAFEHENHRKDKSSCTMQIYCNSCNKVVIKTCKM